jgi:hypothetical protein
MGTVERLASVVASLASGEVQAPNMRWNNAKTVLNVNGVEICILNLRQGIHALIWLCHHLAQQVIDTGPSVNSVVMPASIHIIALSGTSLLDNACMAQYQGSNNPILIAWSEWLSYGTSDGTWNPLRALDLLSRIGHFWRHMAVTLNLTSSAPPRASDFLEATITDGDNLPTIQRTNHGWVMNYTHSKLRTHVHSKFWAAASVHPTLQALFSWCIGPLRSAEVLLSRCVYGAVKTEETYLKFLFVADGVRIDPDAFSKMQKDLTSKYCLAPMGVRIHRQFCVAAMHTYMPTRHIAGTMKESSAESQMMGHSDAMKGAHYARDADSLNLSVDMYEDYMQHSDEWASFIAPTSDHPAPLPVRTLRTSAAEGRHYVEALKSSSEYAHNSRVNELQLARVADAAATSVMSAFTQGMAAQKADLIDTIMDAFDELHNVQHPASRIREDERHSTALEHLRTVLGDPGAQFNPGQYELVKSLCCRLPTNVLAVLPCGSGKTLASVLPAETLEKDQIHLVVVPYRALVIEMSSKARRHGIPGHDWSGDHPDSSGIENGIIYAVPECFDTPALLRCVYTTPCLCMLMTLY